MNSSPLISEQWPLLLEPKLRKIFADEYKRVEPIYKQLFNVTPSKKAQEHDYGIGGIQDFSEFNGRITYQGIGGTYQKTYTHVEYSSGIKIERKLVADDQYNIINKLPQKLGMAAARTKEKLGAQIFNLAFTYEPSDFDACELCASDHPYANATGSQSNEGSSTLSATTLWATRVLMRDFRDDIGEKISVNPDLLLVPPELEATALEAINTPKKPGTDYNDINVVYKKFKVVVWDYLTDSNNWFLIDSSMMKMFLNWFDREPLQFFVEKDFDTLVGKYAAYFRCSQSWSDWRFIYGHLVS